MAQISTKSIRVLFVEECDYENRPIGGQHSFIKGLVFHLQYSSAYLVGVANTATIPIGRWHITEKNKSLFPFFAYSRWDANNIISKMPSRIRQLANIFNYRSKILTCHPHIIYGQSVEAVLPFLIPSNPCPVIFRLAGANNPLAHSRFAWSRLSIFQWAYEKILLQPVIRYAKNIIAINENCVSLCKRLRGEMPPNWIKLPIGIDTQLFKPSNKEKARRQLGLELNKHIIVCVGRLAQVKGYRFALKVLQKMLKKDKAIRLIFVGDGEDRSFLENDAHQRGIDHSISFLGSVTHAKLAVILNAADVFFMPSYAEGLPNALLEAMSCGLPIVASAVGGIPEVITNNYNGFLLETQNLEHACSQLTSAFKANKKLKSKAIETIRERFSIEAVAAKIEQLFLNTIKSGQG